jgi:hypothetical protein
MTLLGECWAADGRPRDSNKDTASQLGSHLIECPRLCSSLSDTHLVPLMHVGELGIIGRCRLDEECYASECVRRLACGLWKTGPAGIDLRGVVATAEMQ